LFCVVAIALLARDPPHVCHSLHRKTANGTTTGGIMNLISSDATEFYEMSPFPYYLLIGPLHLAAVLYLVWQEIGASALAGLGVVVLTLPVLAVVGKLYGSYQAQRSVHQDRRLQSLDDTLVGMRVIKMHAWEKVNVGRACESGCACVLQCVSECALLCMFVFTCVCVCVCV
jgi:hypothetical protein